MSGHPEEESGLERRARAVLEHSLTRLDARTRSRLNRARQAALDAAAAAPRRRLSPTFGPLPIAGAVAAGVLAMALALFMHGGLRSISKSEAPQPSFEVLDMLADDDSIAFMENYDHSFYEWAAAQEDAGGAPDAGGAAGGGSGGMSSGPAGDASGGTDGGASG